MPHLINDIPYKRPDGTYQMVVEIPAGTNDKWQTDAETGQLHHEILDGKPRVIRYLPYPFNYGFVPQTLSPKSKGGDGDALDILLIAPFQVRGSVQPIKVLGGLKLADYGGEDIKLIGVLPDGPFGYLNELDDLNRELPGAMDILQIWFRHYKGPGKMWGEGQLTAQEATALIETNHADWEELT